MKPYWAIKEFGRTYLISNDGLKFEVCGEFTPEAALLVQDHQQFSKDELEFDRRWRDTGVYPLVTLNKI